MWYRNKINIYSIIGLAEIQMRDGRNKIWNEILSCSNVPSQMSRIHSVRFQIPRSGRLVWKDYIFTLAPQFPLSLRLLCEGHSSPSYWRPCTVRKGLSQEKCMLQVPYLYLPGLSVSELIYRPLFDLRRLRRCSKTGIESRWFSVVLFRSTSYKEWDDRDGDEGAMMVTPFQTSS